MCFNSAKTISKTIDSVLQQTNKNVQYILVDGCSTDGTVTIIKNFAEIFRESGVDFQWVSEPDNGIYDAINKGIKMASGNVIGILNSDDYYYDEKVLEDLKKTFEGNVVDCVYGNLVYVDPNKGNQVSRRWISKPFKQGLFEKSWTPAHPTFYCKRNIYEQYGLYRTDFQIAADVELMYRFLEKHQIRSFYFDRFMVIMRRGGISNRGIQSTFIITQEMKMAINENGGQFNILKYLFFKVLKLKELIII